MFRRLIGDLKRGLRATLQGAMLFGVSAVAALVAFCFLCAAGFVVVLDRYGLIAACLAGAGLFLIVAVVLAVCGVALSRRSKRQAEAAKRSAQAALADPLVIAAGIQMVRSIGVRRLGPLLAIAGLALSLLMKSSRPARSDDRSAK